MRFTNWRHENQIIKKNKISRNILTEYEKQATKFQSGIRIAKKSSKCEQSIQKMDNFIRNKEYINFM